MKDKIKVLCVPSDKGGCGLHRSVVPHNKLEELYGNEFDVTIDYFVDWKDLNRISTFDIIHFHKGIYPDMEGFKLALDFCKKNNIVTIMDIDDYWELGQQHPQYHMYKQNNICQMVKDNLIKADYITTTTPIFANKIKKFNKNVKVFPNALDSNIVNKIKEGKKKSKRIRFGFVMGSTHQYDMELVRGLINKLPNNILDKMQVLLCGYDLNGTMTEIKNGQSTRRPLRPEETVWYDYECNVTENYRIVSPQYKDFLLKFIPNLDYPNSDNELYKRCWTNVTDNYEYLKHYNDIDVLLVPLQENAFNECKSELKFVEGGMMGVAVVASNVNPYTIGSKNFLEKGGKINEDGNCILIENRKAHKDWAKVIEKLVNNPEYITKLQENMSKHISENYDINKITQKRAEWYKQICKNNG